MDEKRVKAKAIVKVTDEQGKWCLFEIRGLKEGTILTGTFNPINNAFDFTWNGEDAMLWIGSNGELVEKEQLEVAVADFEEPDEYGSTEWHDCDNLVEARKFKKEHGGVILYGASIVCTDTENAKCGEYLVDPIWREKLSDARKDLSAYYNKISN